MSELALTSEDLKKILLSLQSKEETVVDVGFRINTQAYNYLKNMAKELELPVDEMFRVILNGIIEFNLMHLDNPSPVATLEQLDPEMLNGFATGLASQLQQLHSTLELVQQLDKKPQS